MALRRCWRGAAAGLTRARASRASRDGRSAHCASWKSDHTGFSAPDRVTASSEGSMGVVRHREAICPNPRLCAWGSSRRCTTSIRRPAGTSWELRSSSRCSRPRSSRPRIPTRPARPLLFAEGLSSESGGRTFSAPVREGVRFSDGTPLTAELMAEILSQASRLVGQARVEARDGRVLFHLEHPASRFDHVLTHRYCEVGLRKDDGILGTGPYRVAADSTPERVRLVANPERPAAPAIEEILFVAYPPDEGGVPTALLEAIEREEVEFSNVLSREHIGQLKGVRKWLEPGIGTASLYFNTERPAMPDLRVRQALALAIDRTEVARISYHNPMSFTATGLLPPMLGTWRDGIRHDPKKAAALLAAVGDARPEAAVDVPDLRPAALPAPPAGGGGPPGGADRNAGHRGHGPPGGEHEPLLPRDGARRLRPRALRLGGGHARPRGLPLRDPVSGGHPRPRPADRDRRQRLALEERPGAVGARALPPRPEREEQGGGARAGQPRRCRCCR